MRRQGESLRNSSDCERNYSFKMREGKEEKKCKGVKKSVVKKKISHQNYKVCLFSGRPQMRKKNVIRSHRHESCTRTRTRVCPNKMNPNQIPFNALIVGPTNSGKTKYLVDLLSNEFRGKFDYLILLCPTYTLHSTRLIEVSPRKAEISSS